MRRKLSRAELLAANEQGWGSLVRTFRDMSAAEQERYLREQGYDRLQDLLAHVIAWHEETRERIERELRGDDAPWNEDVDAFNARAVERFGSLPEAVVAAAFERACSELGELVLQLPDPALADDRINEWLYVGIVEHYDEHRPTETR